MDDTTTTDEGPERVTRAEWIVRATWIDHRNRTLFVAGNGPFEDRHLAEVTAARLVNDRRVCCVEILLA